MKRHADAATEIADPSRVHNENVSESTCLKRLDAIMIRTRTYKENTCLRMEDCGMLAFSDWTRPYAKKETRQLDFEWLERLVVCIASSSNLW